MTVKYNIYLRLMHWVMAIMVISMITLGIYMKKLSYENPLKEILYGMHISFGILVGIMTIVRIIVRVCTKAPPFPTTISYLLQAFGRVSHYSFYLFILSQVTFGYLMNNYAGYNVSFFYFTLPKLVSKDDFFAAITINIHQIVGYTLAILIVFHILGAFKHLIWDKINLFKRII